MKLRWAPAIILLVGVALTLTVEQQRSVPLLQPLGGVVPREIGGFVGTDLVVSEAEAEVAGYSNALLRIYERVLPDEKESEGTPDNTATIAPSFSIYVGYYESQERGRTIHSPKNCLPGAGWEALSSAPYLIELTTRSVTVNRYVLQNGSERAVVLYWYQGRGRIAHDEYRVKINLLRDAALRRRSDEALVRIVVPVDEAGEDVATELAVRTAHILAPALDLALPGI